MNILAWYDLYISHGFQIIPLHPSTKVPLFRKWNKEWNSDYMRYIFSQNPNCNMGFLLGDIIDIEGDTIEANKRLMKITKNCPHPMYSSSKSIHHLFLNPDPSFKTIKYEGIEFRGNKCQSVLPPSKHQNGKPYFWLPESRFPIPKMPTSVLNLLKLAKKVKNSQKPGSKFINCCKCEEEYSLHFKRLNLEIEAFKVYGYKWHCHKCRTIDVRPLCREIRKKLKKNATKIFHTQQA